MTAGPEKKSKAKRKRVLGLLGMTCLGFGIGIGMIFLVLDSPRRCSYVFPGFKNETTGKAENFFQGQMCTGEPDAFKESLFPFPHCPRFRSFNTTPLLCYSSITDVCFYSRSNQIIDCSKFGGMEGGYFTAFILCILFLVLTLAGCFALITM